LSPSGKYLSARVVTNGKLGLLVKPLQGDEEPYLLDSGERWTIRNTLWVSDHEILVGFSRPLSFDVTAVLVTRTMRLNMKTRKARTLFQRETGAGFLQMQNRFLGRIPDQEGAFLLEGTKGSNPKNTSVYAVTGAPSKLPGRPVQTTQKDVFNWQADRLGNVRVGHGFTPDQQRGVLKLKDAQGTWHDVSALIDREARVLALPTRDLNVYLVLMLPKDPADGSGLRHVYEYNVSSGAEELAYAANHSEVAAVLMDLKGEDVILVQYQDEALPPVIFHPLLKEIYAALGARFPDAWIGLYDVSDDLSRALFVVNSPKVPGALYLYNAEERDLKGVSIQYPGLSAAELAEVYPITYPARDGLEIPAYLTLPNGMSPESARELPFVVLPHGGLHARDFRRFDWLAQILANEGYGVLQMNFRGSTGYGADFEQAGRKQWATVMIDDITDGAKWLVDRGMANPERMCVVGASFGGYAAMMSLVKEPRLYECGVSLNGVSDLISLIKNVRRYIGGTYYTRHIGHLASDSDALRQGSPINGVKKVQVPLMLVHSDRDRVVPPRQTRKMAKALTRAQKSVQTLELPQGDHFLSRQDNRKAFSEALLSFLAEHLGEAAGNQAPR
jgi:dipeptidyl aminopeptidase/acylaminoacyl peptidase